MSRTAGGTVTRSDGGPALDAVVLTDRIRIVRTSATVDRLVLEPRVVPVALNSGGEIVMGVPDIEYGTGHARLEALLRAVERPGDFCAHGRLFAPMPRLEVEGAGMVSFPVPEAQARALIEAAERAPYGKGPETLVDTAVRDCWQIDAERVRLGGGAWPETFARILDTAAAGLGCPSGRLDARLYKLLVYEPGGFFLPHRDTEKADGMIATLSVSLPVAGAGGELLVRHQDREITVDMHAEEPSELAFAAFYADCTHEIRPVLEGHRLSLVFNLCIRPGDRDTPREAPDHSRQIAGVAQQLAEWSGEEGATDKLVWLLDHEYSESGLSFAALKNSDAAVAQVLTPAAERAGCELYAAVVHVEESGEATFHGDNVGGYGGDWDEGDVADMDVEEVYDDERWLDGWAARDGGRPPFAEIPLEPGELLPAGALDDAEPDSQRLHEATGNEGATLYRAYHRAAFVIWPRAKALDIVAGAGLEGAVAWVAEALDRNAGVVDDRIGGFVSRLTDLWASALQDGRKEVRLDEVFDFLDDADDQSRSSTSGRGARIGMLDLLRRTGDEARLGRFLHEVVLSNYGGGENEALAAALAVVGPKAAGRFLPALVEAHFARNPGDTLALLRRLGEEHGDPAGPDAAWHGTLRKGVRAALAALPATLEDRTKGRAKRDSERMFNRRAVRDRTVGDAAVRDLFALAWRGGLTKEAATAAGTVVDHPRAVTPDRTLPAALHALHAETGLADAAAFASLWRHAVDFLLARSATPPETPKTWKIAAPVKCRCEHCAKLRAFCKDPAAKTARFPLREELRDHLQEIIERHRLDIEHVTERRGSPYTLVCTKTRSSHERRLAEYAEDVTNMRALADSAPGGKQARRCATDLERLREAIAAAGRS